MQILQNTFFNNVSNLYFKAKPPQQTTLKYQKDLKSDTFEFKALTKDEIKEHVNGIKYMIHQADRLKPAEQEKMLLQALQMEFDFKKEHPDYYIDYRPSKALGDFYLYKMNMPVDAICHYEEGIFALAKFLNDKEPKNAQSLKKIAIQAKEEENKIKEYSKQLSQYNSERLSKKITMKKPVLPKESMEFLNNHYREIKSYKKVQQIGQMYQSIGKCYKLMQLSPVFTIYQKVAKDFQRSDQNAQEIMERQASGLKYFMDLYRED